MKPGLTDQRIWNHGYHDVRLTINPEVGKIAVESLDNGSPGFVNEVARKLNAPDLPLTEQVIGLQNIIGRAIETLQGTTGPAMEELKEFAGRMGFNLVPHGTGSKPLPGTDWVIARDTSNMAKYRERPGRLPGQPPELEEMFWSGAIWVKDVGLAKRFRGTQHAIDEILTVRIPDDRPVHWRGCYLARVAARPEPRFEVVDRP